MAVVGFPDPAICWYLGFLLLMLAALPLIAWVIDQPRIVGPGLVLIWAVPAATLLSPLWIYYRRMEFAKQRRLQAADPVVSFVVTIALAIGGPATGVW